MRDVVRGLAAGLLVLLVAGAIADRAGWIDADVPRPTGTGAWVIARASGFVAFAALVLELTIGRLISSGRNLPWLPKALRVELHRWLSPLALALVVGHAAVLLADDFVRFDAIDVLLPFAAPTRRFGVGLGILALYATIVVHASFAFRKRLGTARWRRLHYLSYVAFALAVIHALLAGTDLLG
jgi:DMSO/TMAO reductase YedYZ heme-binding membrane subunit